MQDDPALHPDRRTLYVQDLQPPAGHVFDAGIAATYSMDFNTALAVPVGLCLGAAEDRDALLANPLALLEGAQRVAKRLLVFTDAGRIHASSHPKSRLCSLLEGCIVEVMAPGDKSTEGGAFHPKLWLLRFKPTSGDGPLRMRLIILSRNLTADRSWDIALSLDGEVHGGPQALNRPVAELIAALPTLAQVKLSDEQTAWIKQLVEQLRRTRWEIPKPFEEVAFAVNGLGGKQWQPGPAKRLGIVSPFCDERTLSELAKRVGDNNAWMIGRSDQLACVSAKTLTRFARVAVLDDRATTEDGNPQPPTPLEGLHAKIFIAEAGAKISLTVGSGNATCAGLKGKNVEVFATLVGPRAKVGSVEQNLGTDGFGSLARDYVPDELQPPDERVRAGEERLRSMHRTLCKAGLQLRCERVSESADAVTGAWLLTLVPKQPLELGHSAGLEAWPITVSDSHAKQVGQALATGEPTALATLACADISAFVAFRLVDSESGQSLVFSTRLPMPGLPEERDGAVLRSLISNRQSFMGYLRLLLADGSDLMSAGISLKAADSGKGDAVGGADDMPMLEDLMRAFCRGEVRAFDTIDDLMRRLDACPADGADPVPERFRELWAAFSSAREMQEQDDVA